MRSERTPLALPDRVLADGEVVLRVWDASDVQVVLAGGLDAIVSRFRYSLPRSPDGARDWIAAVSADRLSGSRLELAVTEGNAVIGSVSLTDFEHGNAMVRYWLLPEGRGRGLATRAVKLCRGVGVLRPWGRTTRGLHRA